ncbi:MAG: aminotransferase class V-fold PLP-dependent enzyme [Clostridia bacterium]|nr:aminotransferase class V-fold PLP-dependent enzyme [Clostridia bacterium]
MINFDNAATTGRKPESVISAVSRALRVYSANPGRGGHDLSVEAARAVYSVREKTASFFGASGGEKVIFTANCTASVNYVLKGFLGRNDHVIISDLEHNAVVRPLKKIGAKVSVANVDLLSDEKTVRNFASHITESTKLIFCTAASNVCGRALPIGKIGELCKSRGVAFGVDAAQTAGVVPIDMERMNIDFLCVAPHKGLYAPMGIGILIACRDIGDTLLEGGTGTNSLSEYQPDMMPERYESGTLNVPAIMGVSAGIDFSRRQNFKAYANEMNHIRRIYESFEKMPHVRLYTPYTEDGMYMPLLSFNVENIGSEQVAEYLNKKGIAVRAGLHCAPLAHRKLKTEDGGTVRIAPSVFTTAAEVDYLISQVKYINI